MVNFQPSGLTQEVYSPDKLLVMGPFETRSVTLLQAAAQSGVMARGTLLCINAAGKFVALDTAETTIALGATTEVVVNNLQAAGALIQDYVTAKPPIPGSLTMATTADGSATHVLELGSDNGRGIGSGAGGSFTLDYNTGRGRAVLGSAPTNGDDLKVGYKHRSVLTPYGGSTVSPYGLPIAILAEEITEAALKAGDVVSLAYVRGTFNSGMLVGYSAGYDYHLNNAGIYVKANVN